MQYILLVLVIINLILTFYLLFNNCKRKKYDKDHRYLMYIGLNDKDTGVQEKSTEEILDIVNHICVKYLKGYNIKESIGYWRDDNGQPCNENSIVVSFNFIEDKNVHVMANEVVKTLNQECVFIEDYHLTTEFYPSN